MVYCGRPSRGCEACRKRKSRCDQLPDGCTYCKKSNRECIYRSLGDVIFHNESANVARKAKLKAARGKVSRDTSNTPPTQVTKGDNNTLSESNQELAVYQSPWADLFQSTEPTSLTLLPSLDELATGSFMYNFVFQPKGENGPRRFQYMESGYSDYAMNDGLMASMRAVGLANYAHTACSGDILFKARQEYTRAIRFTNKSLACPESAKKDTTLLSILVLGIFETVTGSQQQSLKEWSQHVNGAAAVIALRGPDQIKTMTGRHMLFQVVSNLVITCIAPGKPLPKYILDLNSAALNLITDPDPALLVQQAMINTVQLRAKVLGGNITDKHLILRKAQELDVYILSIMQNPPASWAFDTLDTTIKASFLWKGKYHVYKDCWSAQLWNGLRSTRLIVNEMIRDVLLAGFATKPPEFASPIYPAQFQLSTDTLFEVQNDILCSIPSYLFNLQSPNMNQGQNDISEEVYETSAEANALLGQPAVTLNTMAFSPGSDSISDFSTPATTMSGLSTPQSSNDGSFFRFDSPFTDARRSTNAARTYGGSYLLWPIWYCGVLDVATDEVKKFVVQNLKDVGQALGIKHGFVLAEIIEKGMSGPILG